MLLVTRDPSLHSRRVRGLPALLTALAPGALDAEVTTVACRPDHAL